MGITGRAKSGPGEIHLQSHSLAAFERQPWVQADTTKSGIQCHQLDGAVREIDVSGRHRPADDG
jgi:hypothetical protein